ncbi:hypothetical protein Pst134EA_021011 [Puccinia striiformis f. sp. tritici]|uniref:hypothetical protein n=1 Tax=Puccinia striiformis f. sp. tritici TaxID=168172 RepID=UPI002007B4D4|nr:hypothetical protein Pst134EA_021011 [Puccinia striiformis f. sp. tritici]KAH9457116.1 hypothetical protein Pst134EA_021011 [Puccinia striiformis f. sp. tritici]
MMSREFRLPYFGPKKLPSTRKSIKPGDIPTPLNHLLPQVYTIINNRQRQFKRTERDRPQAWWRLVEHRKPTRWCLYRNLIKHAKWFDALHPSKIHPQSPILTNWIRSQFREHRSIRTVPHAQEILRQAYSLLTRLVNSKYGDPDDLNQTIYDRDQLLETQNRKIWGKVYKAQLDARRPPTPIMTGRFLRPSVLNGPLPRLAHQPLHISMMMSSRRKARERRMIEHRHLQEKLDTIRTESAFDSVLQPHHRNIFEQEHKSEGLIHSYLFLDHSTRVLIQLFPFFFTVKGILDRLDVINNSFRLEKQRERVGDKRFYFIISSSEPLKITFDIHVLIESVQQRTLRQDRSCSKEETDSYGRTKSLETYEN